MGVANGALEGMNNKVKLVSHRADGYRNSQHYIAAVTTAALSFSFPQMGKNRANDGRVVDGIMP